MMFGHSAFAQTPFAATPTAAASAVTTTAWMNPTSTVASGWTTPNNVLTSNDGRAAQTIAANTESTGFYSIGFDGLSVPAGATILGIEFRVEGAVTAGSLDYNYFFITRGADFTPIRSTASRSLATPFTGTEAYSIVGGSADLWGGADTNSNNVSDRAWLPADFDSQLSLYAAFAAGASGATVEIDNIQMRVTYEAAAGGPTNLPLSYTNTGSGSQSYVPSYKTTLVYTNSGVGAQAYVPTYRTALAYSNNGTGTQSYTPQFKTDLSYSNSGTAAQAYNVAYTTALAYSNSGTGTQNYSIDYAGAGLGYTIEGVGTQSYTVTAVTGISYSNVVVGSQSYNVTGKVAVSYTNAGVGTQNYSLVGQPKAEEDSAAARARRGASFAPGVQPASQMPKAKLTLVAKAVKEVVPEVETIDWGLIAQIEAMRVAELEAIAAQELAAQLALEAELEMMRMEIEEEEMLLTFILAAKQKRRLNPFHRLAA